MKYPILCDCTDGFSGPNCLTEDLCITNALSCLNGGTCLDGICDCPDGYDGTNCSVLWRNIFLGNYTIIEDCDGNSQHTYTGIITENPDDVLKIGISLFSGTVMLNANLLTASTFEIPKGQTGDNAEGFSGTGSIGGKGVVLLNLYFAPSDLQCDFICTPI